MADVLDWDDLRFFLAVARHGSLTAATKELGVAQSTVGRRLASLEGSLSARLLLRTPEGYKLTLAGESVKAQAERVEAEALTVERTVGGQDERLQGVWHRPTATTSSYVASVAWGSGSTRPRSTSNATALPISRQVAPGTA